MADFAISNLTESKELANRIGSHKHTSGMWPLLASGYFL